MQRYFVDPNNVYENKVIITDGDYHHITKVMRMKEGNNVLVSDGTNSYKCVISQITDCEVVLEIIETLNEKKELPVKVTIAHGITRREKMEEVIDKITQLGASFYLPINMERCNVKFNDEKLDRKMERMNKIAKEAAEQSHRTSLLIVEKPISFKEMINLKDKYDLCLYAYEITSKDKSLKEVLKENSYKNIIILIGPEGGISDKEVDILNKNNFLPVSLGPRILRTEVAPTYAMAAISYELEE